jgi:hypothetical protein
MSFRRELTEKLSEDYKDQLTVAKGMDYVDDFLQGLESEWEDILKVTDEVEVDIVDNFVRVGNTSLQFSRMSNYIHVTKNNHNGEGYLVDNLAAVSNGTLKSARYPEQSLSDLFDTYLKEVFGS